MWPKLVKILLLAFIVRALNTDRFIFRKFRNTGLEICLFDNS